MGTPTSLVFNCTVCQKSLLWTLSVWSKTTLACLIRNNVGGMGAGGRGRPLYFLVRDVFFTIFRQKINHRTPAPVCLEIGIDWKKPIQKIFFEYHWNLQANLVFIVDEFQHQKIPKHSLFDFVTSQNLFFNKASH